MEPTLRDAARQTAEDFEWLEAHCRARTDLARHAGELRLAAALTRNVIGPAMESVKPPPLFLAVVGGAGAGKSTAINFLAGSLVAEANPQAGYTRHPSAFLPPDVAWPTHLGFIGPLRRLDADAPANLDEDVYQVRRLPANDANPLADFVLWDCPDMTAWASTGYVSRLLEVSALSDVIVYIASDERYNDEVPTQFLQLLIRGGKAVVVVLTKMNADNAAAMADHFRREVLNKIASPEVSATIPIHTIPHLNAETRNDPTGAGATWRVPLVNQVLVLCPTVQAARDRTTANAVRFLESAADGLLEVARKDLAELDAWKAAVAAGRASFETRYRNEYLAGEPFRRFERTRAEILGLLELPGQGRAVSGLLQKLRFPFEWAAQQLGKLIARPDPPNLAERSVLSGAMAGWLDALQAESLRRANGHALWKQLSHSFDAGLKSDAQQRFDDAARQFEQQEVGDLENSTKAIVENIAAHPTQLTAMRVGKAALEVVTIIFAIWATFHYDYSFWNLIWVIPLAAFVGHGIAEIGVRLVVERERRKAREQREALLASAVTRPLGDWLDARPTSGGSSVERLQAILSRVPTAIKSLAAALGKPGGAA